MKFKIAALFVILFTSVAFQNSEPLLSEFAKHHVSPWLNHEANSEQRQPVYIGASPKEMELNQIKASRPQLRSKLKSFGEAQAAKIAKNLRVREGSVELEAWPYQNDEGDQAWVFARWRKDSNDSWHWLEEENWKGTSTFAAPAPALPILLKPWVKKDRDTLFRDFLELGSLYDKPYFGDAIWTTVDGSKVLGAWYPLTKLDEVEKKVTSGKEYVARVIPQPARFNASPVSFILRVEGRNVIWPEEIQWVDVPDTVILTSNEIANPLKFPSSYSQEYQDWVEKLAGENSVHKRKNSADPENDLEAMADDLQKYYENELGLKTKRQKFQYRGYTQSNLIAIIPGKLPRSKNRPVLFADHYDTAFEEDTHEESGKRVATHGANDNITATASLLVAAKMLKDSKPKNDIWLVHLTGEEFPADDLGARHFLAYLMKEKIDIKGLVLIDMIGFRKKGDSVFQINLGKQEESKGFGKIALSAAKEHAPKLTPKIRGRFDEESYLYNTDGYIFTNLGFPVIYFNEHLNRKNMGINVHYHQSTDVPKNVDFTYAVPISKTSIATLWELANE